MTAPLRQMTWESKTVDDQALIRQFRQPLTREKAFRQIMQRYQQRVYGLVIKIVEDHGDADDVVQEVFVKVWKGLDKFREDARLFTWIYRIATNESLNYLKKRQRRKTESIEDYHASAQPGSPSEPNADRIEALLQQAIRLLPKKQRLVFHMKYYDEMMYKDISQILGTSEGALKASYHLAVKKIEDYVQSQAQ